MTHMNEHTPPRSALLLIDVQQGLVDAQPYQWPQVCDHIQQLLAAARRFGIAVIHVQHQSPPGTLLAVGNAGWQIVPELAPLPGEPVFAKTHNSAFKQTGLQAYLAQQGIDSLIVTGMQTEYCVETTVRVAFEYGYRLYLPQLANTTLDRGEWSAQALYQHHNFDIMQDRFAHMPTVAEMITLMAEQSAAGPAHKMKIEPNPN